MPALVVDNVSFSYDLGTPTLSDISFSVSRSEFLSILGPNGSGKTTLLRLLDRIYVPRRGRILLDGRNLLEYSRNELARRIAFVPQDSSIAFPFTVMEVVLMGRAPFLNGRAFENEHDREIAVAMMERTDIRHLARQPVTALSGGERQRVLIARALAQQPEIVLLDEPNAHLDIAHQIDIFDILKQLSSETGLTVVSVSHDLNLASLYSTRIAMLMCGSLVAVGTPHDVLSEERIRDVFRTSVIVDTHPAGSAPRITLRTAAAETHS